MATIGAADPGHTSSRAGATGKLLRAVDNDLRRIGIGLVSGKRETDNVLDGPFPVRDIGSHSSVRAEARF